MADEPLALSTTPPAEPADDYDAICAALRRTERGRRFLEEHARRHASDPDSLIGAIEPVNIDEDPQPVQPDVLAVVERLQDLTWIMREHGLDIATCEHIETLTSTILAAPSLCDSGNPRAQKLGQALGHLERHVDDMIVAARGRARQCVAIEAVSAPAADRGAHELPEEAASERVPTMWEPAVPLTSSPSPRQQGVTESAPADFLLEPEPAKLPSPKSIVAARSENSSPDLDNELSALLSIPIFQATPTPSPTAGSPPTAASPAPIRSTSSDPLAALNAMSDEEKIALFT